MNYIILNGMKSTLVKGLLISKLPPITKPLMRTQIEQIDGRDGDIVTKLGYSAYDKELEIGLHGNYDVDEVIKYFDSEGTVTFSNEPDKYYNYQIIEHIDFEKLIRFKKATVTFHVQPFKYSTVDNLFRLTPETGVNSITVLNRGNIFSKPAITIYGSGVIYLYLNNTLLFTINMPTSTDHITIDAEGMNAYAGDTFMNRYVTGNYDKLAPVIGRNVISWSGNVTYIEIKNFTRWR